MRRVTILYQNKPVEADQIDYEPEREPWIEVRLEDGTRLRAKFVITAVHRVVDAYVQDGTPLYSINSSTIVMADAPPNLKKPEAAHAG